MNTGLLFIKQIICQTYDSGQTFIGLKKIINIINIIIIINKLSILN